MANINREAVLSAAWILIRRTREAGAPLYGGHGADGGKSLAAHENRVAKGSGSDPDQAHARESVKRMISAYLDTPTHISSQFHSW